MKLLHEEASARRLELVTVLVFGLWFIKLLPDPLARLALLPSALFEPVGFLALVPSAVQPVLLSGPFLWFLKIATGLSIALVLGNRARTPAALVACACITLHLGIARGFAGNIGHQDLPLLYAAYWLALCRLAEWIAARARPAGASGGCAQPLRPEVPIIGTLAALCLTYTFVGIFRLVYGGLEAFAPESLTFWALRNSFHVLHPTWGLGKLLPEYPALTLLLTAGFPIVTAFEICAPLCLFSRRFRQLFLLVMVLFHFVSWLLLDIFFWENLALLLLLVGRSSDAAVGQAKTQSVIVVAERGGVRPA